VTDVAFGVVDGRLMLATACSDHNARLWDPIKPSAARVSGSGLVQRTALRDTLDGPLLAGTAGDGRVFVWRASDGQRLQEFELDLGSEAEVKHAAPFPKELALGPLDGRTVVAATTSQLARAWDVGTGELIGELTLGEAALNSAVVAVADSAVLVAYLTHDGAAQDRAVESDGGRAVRARHPSLRRPHRSRDRDGRRPRPRRVRAFRNRPSLAPAHRPPGHGASVRHQHLVPHRSPHERRQCARRRVRTWCRGRRTQRRR
jgi:hypothetical protein